MALFEKKESPVNPARQYKPRRVLDPETAERRLKLNRQKEATIMASKLIKGDEDAEREYIAATLGITIKPKDPDKEVKDKIKSRIAAAAMEEIESDPVLRSRFARRHVAELLGEKESIDDREEGNHNGDGYEGSSLSRTLDQLDELDEIKARLGGGDNKNSGGNSFMQVLSNPEVVKALIGLLSGGKVQPAQEPMLIVNVDGENVQITAAEYRQLVAQNRVQPIAMINTVKVEQKSTDVVTTPVSPVVQSTPKQIIKYKELPPWIEALDLANLSELFKLSPEEFVNTVKSNADSGDLSFALVWNYLPKLSYLELIDKITPYRGNPKVVELIERAFTNEGKKWVDDCLILINQINHPPTVPSIHFEQVNIREKNDNTRGRELEGKDESSGEGTSEDE